MTTLARLRGSLPSHNTFTALRIPRCTQQFVTRALSNQARSYVYATTSRSTSTTTSSCACCCRHFTSTTASTGTSTSNTNTNTNTNTTTATNQYHTKQQHQSRAQQQHQQLQQQHRQQQQQNIPPRDSYRCALSAVLLASALGISLSWRAQTLVQAAEQPHTRLYAWGSNQHGQLGFGDEVSQPLPTVVSTLSNMDIVQVATAGHHTLALTASGHVYSFGRGRDRVLGHADDSETRSPRLIESLVGKRIVFISTGLSHSAFVDDQGVVYTCGKVGLGHRGDGLAPAPVTALTGHRIVEVACGRVHTLALTDAGQLFSWGTNAEGALGVGDRVDRADPVQIALEGVHIKAIAAGNTFSLALDQQGQVYAFGQNDYGQIGQGHVRERYFPNPMLIKHLSNIPIKQIAAGEYHAAAVDQNGRVYCWGCGQDGQMGVGSRDLHNTLPKLVISLSHHDIASVACGGGHTAAIDTRNGTLYIWGRGVAGQLGRANQLESVAAYRDVPVPVTAFDSPHARVQVTQAALGNDFSTAIAIPIAR